jgi:hypothetical protein
MPKEELCLSHFNALPNFKHFIKFDWLIFLIHS